MFVIIYLKLVIIYLFIHNCHLVTYPRPNIISKLVLAPASVIIYLARLLHNLDRKPLRPHQISSSDKKESHGEKYFRSLNVNPYPTPGDPWRREGGKWGKAHLRLWSEGRQFTFIIETNVINEMKTKKLICINNLQGQTLQTLKWYKGTYEFYRYEPGNYPEQKKFFSLPELYLDVSIGKI